MKTLTVHTSKEYDVLIGKGLLDRAGDEVQKRLHPAKAVIVTDSNVGPLYAATVKRSLQAQGIQAAVFTFPAGEAQKRLSTISEMYEVFAAAGLTRGDLAVALGGGVTGDMCGFASATYLRGIPFVQIPTSLLAQVDSSVGGKTGVDLEVGKTWWALSGSPPWCCVTQGCSPLCRDGTSPTAWRRPSRPDASRTRICLPAWRPKTFTIFWKT